MFQISQGWGTGQCHWFELSAPQYISENCGRSLRQDSFYSRHFSDQLFLKNWDVAHSKTFSDDELIEMLRNDDFSLSVYVKYAVGKENTKKKNAGYLHFYPFPQNFQKCILWGLFKVGAEPHSSVGSVVDLKIGGRWVDPRLGQYSFRRLMIVVATGFIPLSPLSVVSTMVMWESSQWLGKNIRRSTG